MRRRLSQLLAVVWLLLLGVVAGWWVRSRWVADGVQVTRRLPGPTTDLLCSTGGKVWFRRWAPPANPYTLRDSPAG